MRILPEKIWDLSQPVIHGGPNWPEQAPPVIRRSERAAVSGFNVETIEMTDHTGTHVDAPFHHDDEGATIDRIPIEKFAAPALFMDLREQVEPNMGIGPRELEPWLGELRPGDFAILATGWGGKRANTTEFLERFPYLGGDGARLLLDHDVAGVGIDCLSIGGFGGPSVAVPAHDALLSAGLPIVEDLHVPAALLGRRAFFAAFPILLTGTGGSPCRAVAWDVEE